MWPASGGGSPTAGRRQIATALQARILPKRKARSAKGRGRPTLGASQLAPSSIARSQVVTSARSAIAEARARANWPGCLRGRKRLGGEIERLGGEGFDANLQILFGDETRAAQKFERWNGEPVSIWLSQEVCLGMKWRRMRWWMSSKNASRMAIDASTPDLPFSPRSSSISHRRATRRSTLSEICVLRLSAITRHFVVGAPASNRVSRRAT